MKPVSEHAKVIHNALAYPFGWEKVGLGDLPVEKVRLYAEDRAAQIATYVDDQIRLAVERATLILRGRLDAVLDEEHLAAVFDRTTGAEDPRPRAGEVLGVDDDGPVRAEYVSRYPRGGV